MCIRIFCKTVLYSAITDEYIYIFIFMYLYSYKSFGTNYEIESSRTVLRSSICIWLSACKPLWNKSTLIHRAKC